MLALLKINLPYPIDIVNETCDPPFPMQQEYLTQADAAQELGVKRQRVHTLIQTERIATKTIGGIRMITRQELERFKKTRNGGKSQKKR